MESFPLISHFRLRSSVLKPTRVLVNRESRVSPIPNERQQPPLTRDAMERVHGAGGLTR
jgi:hypothetical protein